jgi:hypothetical protein
MPDFLYTEQAQIPLNDDYVARLISRAYGSKFCQSRPKRSTAQNPQNPPHSSGLFALPAPQNTGMAASSS